MWPGKACWEEIIPLKIWDTDVHSLLGRLDPSQILDLAVPVPALLGRLFHFQIWAMEITSLLGRVCVLKNLECSSSKIERFQDLPIWDATRSSLLGRYEPLQIRDTGTSTYWDRIMSLKQLHQAEDNANFRPQL